MYPVQSSEHYGQCSSRFEERPILMVGFQRSFFKEIRITYQWAAKATMQLGHGQSQRLPALLSFLAYASSVSV